MCSQDVTQKPAQVMQYHPRSERRVWNGTPALKCGSLTAVWRPLLNLWLQQPGLITPRTVRNLGVQLFRTHALKISAKSLQQCEDANNSDMNLHMVALKEITLGKSLL